MECQRHKSNNKHPELYDVDISTEMITYVPDVKQQNVNCFINAFLCRVL